MAVHLTRIYTRTGDDGTTALGDFSRVSKTDPRLAAYADTDECNAALGVAVTVGGLAARRRSHPLTREWRSGGLAIAGAAGWGGLHPGQEAGEDPGGHRELQLHT